MTTYAELQKQIAELQAQAEALKQQELAAVIAEINEKIATYGLAAEQLRFPRAIAAHAKSSPTLKAKYRDPATGQTWVGRGATPKWMRAYIEQGKSKEEFLIL